MRIGVLILPEDPWQTAVQKWQRAEALGFDHVWTYDHVVWDGLPNSPWFGAVPTLAAAGLATERIRIGTLVATPNFRHPVPFARELLTLDDITGGRVTLGLGAGSRGSDATLLGQNRADSHVRTERFAEFVEVLDLVLRGDMVSFTGRHWSVNGAILHPGCVQQPRIPFAVAGTVPRTMEIAAKHASMWVTNGDRSHRGPPLQPTQGAEVVNRQWKRLEQACERQGRDPSSIDRLVLTGSRLDSGLGSRGEFAELRGIYEAAGVTDIVIHWPRQDNPYAGDDKILDQILG